MKCSLGEGIFYNKERNELRFLVRDPEIATEDAGFFLHSEPRLMVASTAAFQKVEGAGTETTSY